MCLILPEVQVQEGKLLAHALKFRVHVGLVRIIVIMLFRLRMTVDEAIIAYTRLSVDVFSKKTILSSMKTNASLLENTIATVIRTSLNTGETQARKVRMLDGGPKWRVAHSYLLTLTDHFHSFIIASTAKNLLVPSLFRTYISPRHSNYDCTIVEAIRATTAEEPFFLSINIGAANVKETFIHVGSHIANPIKAVFEEAELIFPGRAISCMVSIGSGLQGITGFKTMSTTEHARVLKDVMNDSERTSEEVAKKLSDKDTFYCRLNIDSGLEDIGFGDWERLGDVKTHTGKYLEKYDVSKMVSKAVQALNRRAGALYLSLINKMLLISV